MSRGPADRPAGAAGQVLPFFALVLTIVVLLAGLVIDGALLFQSQRDAEVIAFHAARAGANELADGCAVAPGRPCTLDQRAAELAASTYAATWLRQSDRNLSLPVSPAAERPQIAVRFPDATSIEVTITRCYHLQIALPTVTSPDCPGTWEVRASASAQGLAGN